MSPSRPPHPCAQPACGALVRGSSRCAKHKKPHPYNREAWRKIRARQLRAIALCELRTHCQGSRATEVDHIDGNVMNNANSNLQSLCKRCHAAKTRGQL